MYIYMRKKLRKRALPLDHCSVKKKTCATESTTGLDFGWLVLVVFCGRGDDGADERDRDPYLDRRTVHPTAVPCRGRRLRKTPAICVRPTPHNNNNNRSVADAARRCRTAVRVHG